MLIAEEDKKARGGNEVNAGDRKTAERFAREVSDAPGVDKAWPKVTTVLDAFGESSRDRISHALAAAGLVVDPPLEEMGRTGTVCLSVPNGKPADPTEFIRVTELLPGQAAHQWTDLDRVPSPGGLLWIDIDVLKADLASLKAVLPRLCPGLTDERIKDLFLVDVVPKVENDPDAGVRAVSATLVEARETCGTKSDHKHGEAGALAFQLVELVSNEHWLISSWHRERIQCGVEEDASAGKVPEHAVFDEDVLERWQELGPDRAQTAGDLGVLILEELTSSYERARLELYAWLDSWELDFYRQSGNDQITEPGEIDRRTLVDVRALASEFRRQVTPLDIPRRKASQAFFHKVANSESAERVDEVVDRSLDDLKDLTDRVRGDFDLVHLQMSDHHERHNVAMQRKFEVIASLFLAPTLIAGFFGANTWLPGGNDPNAALSFEIMIAAMVLAAIVAYSGIQLLKKRGG